MDAGHREVLAAAAFGLVLAGCSAGSGTSAGPSTSATAVDASRLPLGDGHVSTTPRAGYVDACQTAFPPAGGAHAVGPWIDSAAGTWDSLSKPAVQGSVRWPAAAFSAQVSGSSRLVTTNGLPVDHPTGTFPVGNDDPAAAYDRNPNTIVPQSVTWTLPKDPTPAATPACTPGGSIGVLVDGVLLYNALDAQGRDAGAHEVLDRCDEHPQMSGQLHHHAVSSCLLEKATATSTLVGYALDGYGVYVERDAAGRLLTNAGLDACHGRTSPVLWDGAEKPMYHYVATLEYPYTVGCFHGTPTSPG